MIRGFAYPIQVDPSNGGLVLASDSDLIADHILSFLRIEPGEKVMVPSYGTENQLFKPYDELLTINTLLAVRLEEWIPQAEFRCESEYLDNGEIKLSVFWSLRNNANVQNDLTVTFGRL